VVPPENPDGKLQSISRDGGLPVVAACFGAAFASVEGVLRTGAADVGAVFVVCFSGARSCHIWVRLDVGFTLIVLWGAHVPGLSLWFHGGLTHADRGKPS
jgi:hypothetical protein